MLYQKTLGDKFLNLAVAYMKILATTTQRVSFPLWSLKGTFVMVTLWGIMQRHRCTAVAKKKLLCFACAGAWPVLVDEFVDNMYRYGTALSFCNVEVRGCM